MTPRAFARILVAPAVVLLLAAGVVPLLYAIWTATQADGRFVGLRHMTDLFADPRFGRSLLLTGGLMAAAVVVELALGLGLALALQKIERRAVVVSLLLIPAALAPLIVGIAWWMLFNTSFGPVNAVLGWFGVGPVEWTRSMPWALVAILVAVVWQGTPLVAVILLGGLTTVPASLLEAARLDGAGRWAVLRHVVLPHLRPFFLVAGLLVLLEVARLYEIPFYITEGGPGDATSLAGIYLFKLAFSYGNLGGASMMALLFVAALSVVAALYVRLVTPRRTPA
ncbi:MAG TPA: sugar ABC transporter permease [Planctomycetota bacterium]|nr:sugar ABC transporter permease [Planctomycetota bacterium]